ncbi:S8 family serine peptidase [Sulfidibacter corallicola]|uniref:S8 family serine peptidase n=1 Tax=Sulfidibacter corallicola TaxID=2818388 RepID=A0A8A4TLA8_SULCO|nr:S8 family serine peptidase [Sulfidibacter corallicola]QTD49984.1 S8 family serine peptidase [Sulfidibacter corallicola]
MTAHISPSHPLDRPITSTKSTCCRLFALALCILGLPGLTQSTAPKPGSYVLDLGGHRFDPLEGTPAPHEQVSAKAETGPDLHLVQLQGATRPQWLETLKNNGLHPLRYIAPHAYVVWNERGGEARTASLPFVRWSGPFHSGYRLLPEWRTELERAASAEVVLLVYRAIRAETVGRRLVQLGGTVNQVRKVGRMWHSIRATLPASSMVSAAAIPGVYTLQPVARDGGNRGELTAQIVAGNVNQSDLADPGYAAWLATLGLSGDGIAIASVDTGMDQLHGDLSGRVLPCTGETCGEEKFSHHGTQTAGIAAGDGSQGVLDGDDFNRGLGVAPGASLIEFFYLFKETNLCCRDISLLTREAVRNGAIISNNSWGPSPTPRGYDSDTLEADIAVRDADPEALGDQPLHYVLSIANGNGGTSSQGTPDEGKNLITVGATVAQANTGQQMGTATRDISDRSAHGPCLDGRHLPNLVAPGCYVDSPRTGDTYGFMCGTSAASPHVSGAAALFIERYRAHPDNAGGQDPSPALTKAALLVSATSLAGNQDADGQVMGQPFDSKQGWGRLNLAALLDPGVAVVYFDQETIFRESNVTWRTPMTVDQPGEPVRVMLVWTDAAGHGLGGTTPAWNNDLDLRVRVAGETFSGNQFDENGWTPPGTAPDTRHNTEGVFLETVAGDFDIDVLAVDINSDGLPNLPGFLDQDFAVVCWNCRKRPIFDMIPRANKTTACAADQAHFNLDLLALNGFDQTVTLEVSGLPKGLSAQFDNAQVTPPAAVTLTISQTDAVAPGTYPFSVSAEGGNWSENIALSLELVAEPPPAAHPGEPQPDAQDIHLRPRFTWQAAALAESYRIEVALDAAFEQMVLSESTEDLFFLSNQVLEPDTAYFWRIRPSNACGDGPVGDTSTFRTRTRKPLLLVDDDDDFPDVRAAYTDVLDALHQPYEVWDTQNSTTEPDAGTLAAYELVIWFSGDAVDGVEPKAGPLPTNEAAIVSFLESGGMFWLITQDYVYDLGGPTHDQPTPFMRDYLGLASVNPEVEHERIEGTEAPWAELGSLPLDYPFINFSDDLTATESARVSVVGDQGGAGLVLETETWRTLFWAFPFEAMVFERRVQVMRNLLSSLGFRHDCASVEEFESLFTLWPEPLDVLDLITCEASY